MLALCVSCASKQVEETPQAPPLRTESVRTTNQPPVIRVDLAELERNLSMQRADSNLGFKEKSFNSCRVGAGYPNDYNCQDLVFVTMNIRLQCRDTEGTVSVALTEADIRPIAGREISWQIKNNKGTVQTDNGGYAQIKGIFNRSPRAERLKINYRKEMLYVRVKEFTSVVTPKPWCE